MERCERLKWNRRKLGLSQKELAEKLGVCQATISRLERDETVWTTMRDTTSDAVYDILGKLGSYDSDLSDIFEKPTTDRISEIRKQFREKRISLNMSQKDVADLLGLNVATICKYEKHDSFWNYPTSKIQHKLVEFIDGKFDTNSDQVTDEPEDTPVIDIQESTSIPKENMIVGQIVKIPSKESAESVLSSMISILSKKISEASEASKDTLLYASMIIGLCDGYIKGA